MENGEAAGGPGSSPAARSESAAQPWTANFFNRCGGRYGIMMEASLQDKVRFSIARTWTRAKQTRRFHREECGYARGQL